MQPSQLGMLPVYTLEAQSPAAHFIHVIDVITIDYVEKFNLIDLCKAMHGAGAKRALRTAESQMAIWIPRKDMDSFSLLDERIPGDETRMPVLVHNDGTHHVMPWKNMGRDYGSRKMIFAHAPETRGSAGTA
jgi:hypothetical protein